MRNLNYRILLRKEPEGGYTATVPSLPGCVTYGETVDEAITMAREEAIELYIEDPHRCLSDIRSVSVGIGVISSKKFRQR